MGSENSIDASLVNWMENNNSTHVMIDSDLWPSNKPCSGLSFNFLV
jgi:hypothetical protein